MTALRRMEAPVFRGWSFASGPVELLEEFVATWSRDRQVGYKLEFCRGKFPPLTARQAEIISDLAYEQYWRAGLCSGSLERSKECLLVVGSSLEAAVAEYGAGKKKPSRMKRLHNALRERDGDDCWVCGHELGENATIEHKVALANGGDWSLNNLVRAHQECNRALGRLPLAVKEAAREHARTSKEQTP